MSLRALRAKDFRSRKTRCEAAGKDAVRGGRPEGRSDGGRSVTGPWRRGEAAGVRGRASKEGRAREHLQQRWTTAPAATGVWAVGPSAPSSARERQLELAERSGVRQRRRRLRGQSEPGEKSLTRCSSRGRLKPTHWAATFWTNIKLGPKHMLQQPRPSLAARRRFVVLEQLELIAFGGRRPARSPIVRWFWNDLRAERRMTRKDREVAQ